MIRIFLKIVFCCCILSSCNGSINHSESNKAAEKKITETKDSLEIKANQLKEAYSKNNYFGFFKLFPNTFDEFLKLYGFDDKVGRNNILAIVCEEHINFFFQSYKLSKEEFIPKIFNLSKNGHWEADATGVLQQNIEKFIKGNNREVVEYLATKDEKEIKSFWHFVFDGSSKNDLQNKEKFETLYNKINLIDNKQGMLLKEEFEKMYK